MMLSVKLLASVLLLLTSLCSAQDANPITQPKKNHYLKPGETYDILWTPTTPDILELISIELMCDFNISTIFPGNPCLTPDPTCIELASNISNTGNFTWKIPANAPQSKDYYLDIYVPDPPPGGPYYFMTGNFSINATAPPLDVLFTPPKTATATSSIASATATGNATTSAGASSDSGGGLSTAALGGIIGAVVGGCLLIGFIATLLTLRRKTRYQASKNIRNSRTAEMMSGKIDEPPQYTVPATKEEFEMVEEHHQTGGRIRYPDPDEMNNFVGGRLQSDQRT